ncbi:HIT family protein [Desulfosarcina ovata]|uniref:HIT family protein n=1 Tax=Desulfosarcina ovata TaxID=83564 RepID=UPI0018D88A40|nr:HIT family protein [Desulfosarcina ovata]
MNRSPAQFQQECLFCQRIRSGAVMARLGTAVAFDDGFPVTHGHCLIVPRRHTPDWFSMTDEELHDSRALIRMLADRIRQADPTITGFNIGTNSGASAGQSVFHAHIHLIPRRDGDCPDPKGGVRGVIDGRRAY